MVPDSENRSHKDESQIESLGSIIASYLNFGKKARTDPSPEHARKQSEPPAPLTGLHLLKFTPWVLLILFLFSFIWDLNSVQLVIFGRLFELEGLLRIVSVSGMIGFLTNWIAITMLFRPLQKRPLLGQGLIPKHKNRIAYRLASAVSEDIINTKLINEKIDDSKAIEMLRIQAIRHVRKLSKREDFRNDLKSWLLRSMDTVVQDPEFKNRITNILIADIESSLQRSPVERFVLHAYTLIKGRSLRSIIEATIEKLPESAEQNMGLVDEYLDKLPDKFESRSLQIEEAVKQIVFQLVNQLDVLQFAEENLTRYDEQRVEKMIRNATNEHLKVIQYLGAVLGTIGGLLIWEPVISLLALALLSGIMLAADHQILRYQKNHRSQKL